MVCSLCRCEDGDQSLRCANRTWSGIAKGSTRVWQGVGGIVLSLRSTVVALVASGAAVVVLAAATAGTFRTPPVDPLVPQANPVNQHATAQQPNLIPAPRPAPAQQPAAAAQPAVAPPPAAPRPAVTAQPVSHATPAVRQQPATRPAVVLRPPVPAQSNQAQSSPAQSSPAHDPAPVKRPGSDRQEFSPPPQAPIAASRPQRSQTVNTEPCACDGKMRRVPTHWDPPQD